jgi:hypothetical protein
VDEIRNDKMLGVTGKNKYWKLKEESLAFNN